MKRHFYLPAALLLSVAGFTAIASPAEAHTPSGSATCAGATVSAVGYSGGGTVHVEVKGGGSDTKDFESGGAVATASVPQDGVAHEWSGYVTSTGDENEQEFSGTVGPCGELPVCVPPQTGTPPNCVTPPEECEEGQTGTPPNCVTPQPPAPPTPPAPPAPHHPNKNTHTTVTVVKTVPTVIDAGL